MIRPQETALLRYSAGSVDITPPSPLPLAGYSLRVGPFDGVADPLEANAAVFSDGEQRVAVVTFDLLYVGDTLRQQLEEAVAPWVPAVNLFLAASHTHSAPGTDPTLARLGSVDPAYVEMVAQRVAALVRRLTAELRPLQVGSASSQVNHSLNRRGLGWQLRPHFPFLKRVVKMKGNPRGPRDETVQLIRLGSDALIWQYACHPVFLPQRNQVSADYVGLVRRKLRQQFGSELAVLFWQGFSGNTFPSFASRFSGPLARLKRLLSARSRSPLPAAPPDVWHRWAEGLASQVVRTAKGMRLKPGLGPLESVRAALPLERLLGPGAAGRQVWAHRLDLGPDLRVIGISAEMVVEYVSLLQDFFGSQQLFCVGCLDGVFGYLPTSAMLREGGYEARDFLPGFSLHGSFSPGIEDLLRDQLFARLRPLAGPVEVGPR